MRDRRPDRQLSRKANRKQRNEVWHIFCEGKSEVQYVEAIRSCIPRDLTVGLTLNIDTHTAQPKKLLEHAHNAKMDKSAKKWWIICDVESPNQHADLIQVEIRSKKQGIETLFSNPAFEIWLVWHFADCTKFLSTEDAFKMLNKLTGEQTKYVSGQKYLPRVSHAITRSRQLDAKHARTETTFPENNPSTGMYKLIQAIDDHVLLQSAVSRTPLSWIQ